LRDGITIDGMRYGPIEATLDREQGANLWLTFAIKEGKNREVRNVMEAIGLKVNRLIRVAFGPFELGDLDDGAIKEVNTEELRSALGEAIAKQAGVDFDAPLMKHDAPPRHSGRPQSREPGAPRQHQDSRRDSGAPLREPRNDKRKPPRRDRTGGPRPKYPKPRA
jgi:23S rRNA pseudouridine2605 synthase